MCLYSSSSKRSETTSEGGSSQPPSKTPFPSWPRWNGDAWPEAFSSSATTNVRGVRHYGVRTAWAQDELWSPIQHTLLLWECYEGETWGTVHFLWGRLGKPFPPHLKGQFLHPPRKKSYQKSHAMKIERSRLEKWHKIWSNLSITATLGTEVTRRFREVAVMWGQGCNMTPAFLGKEIFLLLKRCLLKHVNT